ncbi:hypothetical protein F0562_022605 [Nyssa sinensis]|uniref:Uncharacterized protein n=1 Tax=Nyssa sinensis TaxID=561372 RepID=A0A5J5BN72_9ASTE|nr:hypothetical protein F0562_022605 [Nyssa sinensis]
MTQRILLYQCKLLDPPTKSHLQVGSSNVALDTKVVLTTPPANHAPQEVHAVVVTEIGNHDKEASNASHVQEGSQTHHVTMQGRKRQQDQSPVLSWADGVEQGEFIPQAALNLEQDFGGFSYDCSFMREPELATLNSSQEAGTHERGGRKSHSLARAAPSMASRSGQSGPSTTQAHCMSSGDTRKADPTAWNGGTQMLGHVAAY